MASSGEDIGAALARTSALVICCDTAALDKALLDSALNACSAELQQLVLLSSMGVTRAQGGGGIFGIGGGGGAALRDGEARLRAAAAESSLDLSIIRVGHLKGGGPGAMKAGALVGSEELGLAPPYYDSLLQLDEAMCTTAGTFTLLLQSISARVTSDGGHFVTFSVGTMAYDKFTLGARVRAGDPISKSSPLLAMAYKSSFEPREDETSRVVAGGAIAHALLHGAPVELSVGAAKGTAPPGPDEWARLFDGAR